MDSWNRTGNEMILVKATCVHVCEMAYGAEWSEAKMKSTIVSFMACFSGVFCTPAIGNTVAFTELQAKSNYI